MAIVKTTEKQTIYMDSLRWAKPAIQYDECRCPGYSVPLFATQFKKKTIVFAKVALWINLNKRAIRFSLYQRYYCLTGTLRTSFCPSVVGSSASSLNSHIQSHSQVSNTSVLPATMMCLQNRSRKKTTTTIKHKLIVIETQQSRAHRKLSGQKQNNNKNNNE